MSFFLIRYFNNLGKARPERVSIAIAHKGFEAAAKLAFVAKKLANASTKTVVLAGLGQFCKELVEGSIPSTTTWSRASAWLVGRILTARKLQHY